jgi:hypothetical protein
MEEIKKLQKEIAELKTATKELAKTLEITIQNQMMFAELIASETKEPGYTIILPEDYFVYFNCSLYAIY